MNIFHEDFRRSGHFLSCGVSIRKNYDQYVVKGVKGSECYFYANYTGNSGLHSALKCFAEAAVIGNAVYDHESKLVKLFNYFGVPEITPSGVVTCGKYGSTVEFRVGLIKVTGRMIFDVLQSRTTGDLEIYPIDVDGRTMSDIGISTVRHATFGPKMINILSRNGIYDTYADRTANLVNVGSEWIYLNFRNGVTQ